MTYGTKNYEAVASAYGPLTRNMPKSKVTTGQQDGNNQWKQKQKVLHGSLLEYTKRMDKIKQARAAISKSKDQGRLSSVPKQRKHFRMVLPGLDQIENEALSLTNKFISQAQFQSASNVADKLNEQTNVSLPAEDKAKSSIFSTDVQERSKASPNSFKQNWRVLKDVKVRHIPVLKTKDGIVYSTVSRPAKINKPEAETNFEDADTKTTLVKLDENGNEISNVTNENFRKYHPGILPKPGMKGPYKSKVTLHVSLPQMEDEFDGDSDDENDTSSCSIDLTNDGNDSQSSSRVQTPSHTIVDHGKELSSATLKNKEKFEVAISNSNMEGTNGTAQDDLSNANKSSERNGRGNEQPSRKENNARNSVKVTDKSKSVSKTSSVPVTTKTLKPTKKMPVENKHGEKNHYPCDDCPVCKAEMEAKETTPPQTSILKKNDKPLPDIKSSSGHGSNLERSKPKRGSLQQITLPGGVMKLGKLTYHRTYKINVRPVPPHVKNMVGGVSSELTLHDSFADAVKDTNVLKEAERTLRFEKNRKENQERRKKFASDPEDKLMHPLCRHGRFVHECYTCRAVEEIRQRLKNSYSSSEQQYQWNLLSKHERHLTQNVNVAKVQPQIRKNAPFRLSAISKTADIGHIAEDTRKPDGKPGGRVITEKEEGRANPQGLLPTQTENTKDEKGANIVHQNEESGNKKVRFAEERIYDPMRGSYRQGSSNSDQMLVPPIKN